MDMKRKTCGIRTWEEGLFIDKSFTNIDNLPHRFTSASKEVSLTVVSGNSVLSRHHLQLSIVVRIP
jgi:hypothetical protein